MKVLQEVKKAESAFEKRETERKERDATNSVKLERLNREMEDGMHSVRAEEVLKVSLKLTKERRGEKCARRVCETDKERRRATS